ncbi:MAG: cytochrome C oxidase Cbb3 [SAR86 cluster bacterium]|uniref:Cytochrome C oxidase Cbb3 n=1 Tax=SAR86 cluster bacterium TaxID=2030880 RepID=A0A2A5C7Z4_9GAMM|nr:1-acyl-sn-glycerol-3-phosphate acyltransferase [Gammaproteobacteria bacterium AH-315-E17]PCJ39506.1 MAG: cytochrome C oxidase Cbb3 [SAR86 cluster bacterium]
MQDFEDIRPYLDSEARQVVDSLLADPEFSAAIAGFRYPRWYAWFPGIVGKLVKKYLKQETAHIQSIHDVQIVIEKYLDSLIEKTTTNLSHDGLQNLDPNTPYLFISNHRDITMDPALVNYMLYHQGFKTLQIAIGDNLLKRPFLSDLMRLNKSFLVKRGLQGREKLKESKRLSAYIHYCIEQGENVWLAQREGRAKNGLDKTESAILKMLHLAKRDKSEKRALAKAINSLHIVPVAISYGLDPCDESKAKELFAIDTVGKFEKNENSDIQSIVAGMTGDKGDIHVAFGEPLYLDNEVTEEEVAGIIDTQIINNYHLHPSNYFAFFELKPDQENNVDLPNIFNKSKADIEQLKINFSARLAKMPANLRPYLLAMYANPVIAKSI